MENRRFRVKYYLKGVGPGTAFVEASGITSARQIAERMYGEVIGVSAEPVDTPRPSRFIDIDYDDNRGLIHSIGRSLAREHLGVLGESLSDDILAALILVTLALPVIGLWLGLPVYQAMLMSTNVGIPPLTLCIGVGVVALLVGWLILYLCPNIILMIIGCIVYSGWVIFYIAGWRYDVGLLQGITTNIVVSNTDVTNVQKAVLLIAAFAGGSVMAISANL